MKRLLLAATMALMPAAAHAVVFFGPSPYLSIADIPAGFYDDGAPVFLEDFEDGSLDGGLTVDRGGPRNPGVFTDSVDADDGAIDGSGTAGRSLSAFSTTITIELPASVTAAGAVFTDGDGGLLFEAFDRTMVSLGVIGPVIAGDGERNGGTAEDLFFGVQNAGGIGAIRFSLLNARSSITELDHIQYGLAPSERQVSDVPAPASVLLLLSGLAAFAGFRRAGRRAAAICAAVVLAGCAGAATGGGTGIVGGIVKAPVVPDGDVAGSATDVTINLAIDPDPAVPGLALDAGDRIRVTLPKSFVFADPAGFPVMDFLGGPDCAPGRLKCSTVILLQGWPQHPVLPSFPPGEAKQYTVGYAPAENAVTVDILKPLDAAPLPGPGVKQIHLSLLGFRNPDVAGSYPIDVTVRRADGGLRAAGQGVAQIRPAVAPSLNVVSIFDENGGAPPNPNTIYQTAEPGAQTPLAWDFLVWDGDGRAFDGLAVTQISPAKGVLTRAGEVVGEIVLTAPDGASDQTIRGGPAIRLAREPVFNGPFETGRLTVRFTAGSVPGRYTATLSLIGGNSVTHVVDVPAGS